MTTGPISPASRADGGERRSESGVPLFIRVYLVQAVVLWFVSLPVQFAMYGDSFGLTAWLGVALWLVFGSGLRRYTRHPHFGDACVWWGLYLLACSSWVGAATILSPIARTYIPRRVTPR
ncbi:MAG TPA: DUF1295 domain-containing protein [Amycolatopsis sp.]|nr:DUF1295 domain-containing protein [Amycolatopsis sp.]